MMLNYEGVAEITKAFRVLYVEDDETIAGQMTQILGTLFAEVYYAKDGKEGHIKFLKNKPDLVVTDIHMPELDGLEMSKKIRLVDTEIPIIITSAYNELSYLHEAIDIGITAYLTKPMLRKNLLETLFSVCSNIQNKIFAEKYKKDQMILELNIIEDKAVSKLLDIIDTPILLAKDEKVFFVNNYFKEFFSIDNMEEFLNNATLSYISTMAIDKSGYVTDIRGIGLDTPVKVIVQNPKTTFYEVKKKKISVHNDTDEVFLYMFYDITVLETQRIMIEYQKNKLKNINSLLSELFYKDISKREQTDTEVSIATVNNTKHENKSVSAYENLLDDDQKAILHRSSKQKTTAEEYASELEDDMLDEIIELRDIELETASFIDSFGYAKSREDLDNAMRALKTYASCINLLVEFGDVAVAVRGLADFILDLPNEKIDANSKKIVMIASNLLHDLGEWRKNIFEYKTANDIHYLDASLFSSCLQLQFELSDQQHMDESEDFGLELF